MESLKDLKFEVVKSEAAFFAAEWFVPSDLPYLEGHFPSTPIVPAVAMIDVSIELLRREIFRQPQLRLLGIKSSKFMTPLVPGVKVEIECRKVTEREWSVDWKARTEPDKSQPELAPSMQPSMHLVARLSLSF